MIPKSAFLLCLLLGVFGADTDNTETVRVMLGDSLTLHTDIGTVRRDDHIVWVFGPDSPDSQIAELMKWSYMFSVFVSGKMPFRDKLQLNHQTGSLTIKNTKSEHSGLYKLTIIHDRKTSRKRFDVKVYAPLSAPVISAGSSQNSTASERSAGPACVLVCSVSNASRATLSFFKGSDLVSSVSGSDFSSSLSLPLDVEYHDENTYSCVVSNSISNHTTLFNITDLCQPPPGASALFCAVPT
ncbi:SLAM family member 9-like [Sinocyclocheilus rhinocerous]|uniref:SLAM family member 9-like n=1 Tax=Sinocyclocheilus rhinocerous TaxID=307959 RepID=A0A673N161_9TELE|nr:PREDICTED: SLAM family member 9-like [Sinocyclocheilus rhinocerous]